MDAAPPQKIGEKVPPLRYIALALFLALGISSTASAVNFPHNGHVDVFTSIGVAETQDLLFGVVTDADGTVTLDTSDAITADPSGIHAGGVVASGDFNLTGEINQTVAVVLTGSTTAGLTIGTFTSNQASLATVALGAGGSVVLTIGADLTVNSAVAVTGPFQPLNFTVAVTYN
jgi:hypothetical protein